MPNLIEIGANFDMGTFETVSAAVKEEFFSKIAINMIKISTIDRKHFIIFEI